MSAVLLNDVARFLRRFVVLRETQADTLALWLAHTHATDAADATPYIAVTSAEKRSGKTRLLETVELVAREPLPSANISDAALFRVVNDKSPTLLLDEVDAIFKAREREELRGLLNAGYRRGARAHRMGGANNRELQTFAVFCPKIFAGIGACLPDTITDRAITIRLQRRRRDEQVERFRRRDVGPAGEELHDRLADWLTPQLEELARAVPDLPEELDDRAQDVWEPLFAIADLAGGDWPERARAAALELSSGDEREDESLTALLLKDIYAVFANGAGEHVKTSDLIEQLAQIEESPWGDWYGKVITPQALSKLLRPHRIKTMPVWIDGKTARGYKAQQFADAFSRVLGVRGDRSVRSDSTNQAAPNGPNAPNAHLRERAHLGHPMYPVLLAAAVKSRHVLHEEAQEANALHELVAKVERR